MNKKSKIAALLFIVILLFSILFSYEYISANSHHKCVGEDCPVCIQIDESVNLISTIKFIPILNFVLIVMCVFAGLCTEVVREALIKYSLISLKVELLN